MWLQVVLASGVLRALFPFVHCFNSLILCEAITVAWQLVRDRAAGSPCAADLMRASIARGEVG